MKKNTKILVVLLIILILMAVGGVLYFCVFKKEKQEEIPQKEVIVTNTIDEYGYTLEDRDTELFKEKFEELKNLLQQSEFSEETYRTLVSELFIIDFFTIKNKISRYDIGGLEYVYSSALESFKSIAEDTIYKTVENNLDDTRKQDLPVVTNIEVTEMSETTFTMPDDSEVNGYRVALNWEYEENLGYDTSGVLILIPDGKKMSVVFYKAK